MLCGFLLRTPQPFDQAGPSILAGMLADLIVFAGHRVEDLFGWRDGRHNITIRILQNSSYNHSISFCFSSSFEGRYSWYCEA